MKIGERYIRIKVFANVFKNEAMSVVCYIRRHLYKEMKESARTASNDFKLYL